MIVRLMGEGQYLVPDELASELQELDNEAVAAVEQGDETRLQDRLESIGHLVKNHGDRLGDSHLTGSELIIPPTDLSLEETRELYTGKGLIPDLPS